MDVHNQCRGPPPPPPPHAMIPDDSCSEIDTALNTPTDAHFYSSRWSLSSAFSSFPGRHGHHSSKRSSEMLFQKPLPTPQHTLRHHRASLPPLSLHMPTTHDGYPRATQIIREEEDDNETMYTPLEGSVSDRFSMMFSNQITPPAPSSPLFSREQTQTPVMRRRRRRQSDAHFEKTLQMVKSFSSGLSDGDTEGNAFCRQLEAYLRNWQAERPKPDMHNVATINLAHHRKQSARRHQRHLRQQRQLQQQRQRDRLNHITERQRLETELAKRDETIRALQEQLHQHQNPTAGFQVHVTRELRELAGANAQLECEVERLERREAEERMLVAKAEQRCMDYGIIYQQRQRKWEATEAELRTTIADLERKVTKLENESLQLYGRNLKLAHQLGQWAP
ncbi:hypothetical protein BCR43DRAFT_485091 [Syncephalastrum racemosum]|uniref:Uncharacterized protein n=1 Tax=Syncephalastrum racemosum TaxID=13706 RepID=A0A1X2HM04_SYNRA|nr:hypothetical protein BCR43DRAFT_485091 [Syncephalastrum racemosum]